MSCHHRGIHWSLRSVREPLPALATQGGRGEGNTLNHFMFHPSVFLGRYLGCDSMLSERSVSNLTLEPKMPNWNQGVLRCCRSFASFLAIILCKNLRSGTHLDFPASSKGGWRPFKLTCDLGMFGQNLRLVTYLLIVIYIVNVISFVWSILPLVLIDTIFSYRVVLWQHTKRHWCWACVPWG